MNRTAAAPCQSMAAEAEASEPLAVQKAANLAQLELRTVVKVTTARVLALGLPS